MRAIRLMGVSPLGMSITSCPPPPHDMWERGDNWFGEAMWALAMCLVGQSA